jgi:hypothetical protein
VTKFPTLGRLSGLFCLLGEGHFLGNDGLFLVHAGAEAVDVDTSCEEAREGNGCCNASFSKLTVQAKELDLPRGMQTE